MTPRTALAMLCLLASLFATDAVASGPSGTPVPLEPATMPAILASQPLPRVYSAGQPQPDDWSAIAAHGVTTVIDLRPDAERPDRDEASEVAAAGLVYRQIPVAGPQDLTPEAARTLWQSIEAAPGKVLVHCASGNRVGALLAIAAVREGGMAPAQALELGRQGGMASTEARVREVLAMPGPLADP